MYLSFSRLKFILEVKVSKLSGFSSDDIVLVYVAKYLKRKNHTFLLNKNNEIIWQHVGYSEGDEYKLYEEVLKLVEKK